MSMFRLVNAAEDHAYLRGFLDGKQQGRTEAGIIVVGAVAVVTLLLMAVLFLAYAEPLPPSGVSRGSVGVGRELQPAESLGGRNRDRTCDPYHVKVEGQTIDQGHWWTQAPMRCLDLTSVSKVAGVSLGSVR